MSTITGRRMTLKVLILLTTYALLVYGNSVERKDNVESYITKEAAKELRNKLSARGEQQDHDYDEILKRIIMSVQHPSDDESDNAEEVVYEKKYFDYLPNDLDSEDVTDEDVTHELVKTFADVMSSEHEKSADNGLRINSRKFKRDLSRPKRQSIYYVPVPLVHYSPYPNADFYYPQAYQRFQPYPAASSFQNRISDSPNPWSPQYNTGKFHAPNNFYLPALMPSKTHNSNPMPPHNQGGSGVIETGDRIAGFEEDDRPVIWGSNAINSNKNNLDVNIKDIFSPTRPPATKAPPYYSQNSVNTDTEKEVEFEIEHPEENYDDIPKTTRAPLKRPTINKSKNPNRNQRTEATSTTTTTTVRTTKPDRSNSGRQQNKSVPSCVLAIVNCCSKYDEVVRTPCFEKHNCNGAFFGRSPCSPDIKSAAFRELEKFSR